MIRPLVRPQTLEAALGIPTLTTGTVRPLLSPSPHQAWSRSHSTNGGPFGGISGSATPKRRAVTPFNDNGQVPWQDLSIVEKAGRAAQQSTNLGIIAVGLVMTVGVAYFLYTEVFSPDSTTAHINRAIERVKHDPRCVALLGDANQMTAHGEGSAVRTLRRRPIVSSHKVDARGNEHLTAHFFVDGPSNRATVYLHLIKWTGSSEYEYKHLFVDVPGHSRIYLESADVRSASGEPNKYRFFGINWK